MYCEATTSAVTMLDPTVEGWTHPLVEVLFMLTVLSPFFQGP